MKNLKKLPLRSIIETIVIDDDEFYSVDCYNNKLRIHINVSIKMNDNIDCAIVSERIMSYIHEDTLYMSICHKSPTNIMYVIFPNDEDALFFKLKLISALDHRL